MLHSTELKRRNQDEVELPERVGNRRVALEPLERGGMEIEHRLPVPRHLCGIGLAMEHPELPAAASRLLHAEPAGGEGEEVRGQRWRLGEPDAEAAAGDDLT